MSKAQKKCEAFDLYFTISIHFVIFFKGVVKSVKILCVIFIYISILAFLKGLATHQV